MIRELFLGFVKIHILHHAAEGPVYGAALKLELARHGYDLSAGTLYPTLHQLEERGLLKSTGRTVTGRQRRYYEITPAGLDALAAAREKVRELAEEVLRNY